MTMFIFYRCLLKCYVLLGLTAYIVFFNLVIAVVTETYRSIKDAESAVLFWLSRLRFITEIELLSSFFKRYQCSNIEEYLEPILSSAWNLVTSVYEDQRLQAPVRYSKFRCNVARFCFFFVILLWLVLGLVTAGFLWPNEARKRLWGEEDSDNEQESANDKVKPQTLIITTVVSKMQAKTEDKLAEVVKGQEMLMADMVKSQEILIAEMRKSQESLMADIAKLLDERR